MKGAWLPPPVFTAQNDVDVVEVPPPNEVDEGMDEIAPIVLLFAIPVEGGKAAPEVGGGAEKPEDAQRIGEGVRSVFNSYEISTSGNNHELRID